LPNGLERTFLMKLGAYTACLHDQPIADALNTLAGLGLDSAEINSSGFLGTPHLPIDDLRSSETARSSYLGLYSDAGITITALNCMETRLIPIQRAESKPRTSTPPSSWRRSSVPSGW
jgi:sugar phosphate isomerase/epimerase